MILTDTKLGLPNRSLPPGKSQQRRRPSHCCVLPRWRNHQRDHPVPHRRHWILGLYPLCAGESGHVGADLPILYW